MGILVERRVSNMEAELAKIQGARIAAFNELRDVGAPSGDGGAPSGARGCSLRGRVVLPPETWVLPQGTCGAPTGDVGVPAGDVSAPSGDGGGGGDVIGRVACMTTHTPRYSNKNSENRKARDVGLVRSAYAAVAADTTLPQHGCVMPPCTASTWRCLTKFLFDYTNCLRGCVSCCRVRPPAPQTASPLHSPLSGPPTAQHGCTGGLQPSAKFVSGTQGLLQGTGGLQVRVHSPNSQWGTQGAVSAPSLRRRGCCLRRRWCSLRGRGCCLRRRRCSLRGRGCCLRGAWVLPPETWVLPPGTVVLPPCSVVGCSDVRGCFGRRVDASRPVMLSSRPHGLAGCPMG